MLWHYRRGDMIVGPIEGTALYRAISDGTLDEETLVRRDDESDYRPLRERFPIERCWSDAAANPAGSVAMIPPGAVRCSFCVASAADDPLFAFDGLVMCDECRPRYFIELTGDPDGRLPPLPEGISGCSLYRRPLPESELLTLRGPADLQRMQARILPEASIRRPGAAAPARSRADRPSVRRPVRRQSAAQRGRAAADVPGGLPFATDEAAGAADQRAGVPHRHRLLHGLPLHGRADPQQAPRPDPRRDPGRRPLSLGQSLAGRTGFADSMFDAAAMI